MLKKERAASLIGALCGLFLSGCNDLWWPYLEALPDDPPADLGNPSQCPGPPADRPFLKNPADFTWQNPWPTGDSLYAIREFTDGQALVVGDGEVILRWKCNTWSFDQPLSVQRAAVKSNLRALWGLDSQNVWVVGYGRTIFRLSNGTWSAQTVGAGTEHLRGIFGYSTDRIWAVGETGTILHWNGTSWVSESNPSETRKLRSVWGSSENTLWAVGDSGAVFNRSAGPPANWTERKSAFPASDFRSVFGIGKEGVWIAGLSGTFGSAPDNWKTIPTNYSYYLHNIHGVSSTDLWIVGGRDLAGDETEGTGPGYIGHFDGSTVTTSFIPEAVLRGAWATSANNVWAVGYHGTILKWNGQSWNPITEGKQKTIKRLWGADASNVWAVGAGGTILKWNGTTWTAQNLGTTVDLNGVWGTDRNNVWAVGAGGTILKWNGTAWAAQTSGTTANLNGVWGTDPNRVWVVGTTGVILAWNGSIWQQVGLPGSPVLNGIWGTAASNIWVVGAGGKMWKWNGGGWTVQTSGTAEDLFAVSGTTATDVWAVGANSTVLKGDGSSWTNLNAKPSVKLTSVLVRANSVLAVGASGALFKIDKGNTRSASMDTGTGQTLYAVWPDSSGTTKGLWIAGVGGSILYTEKPPVVNDAPPAQASE